jgi:hypothetical protein
MQDGVLLSVQSTMEDLQVPPMGRVQAACSCTMKNEVSAQLQPRSLLILLQGLSQRG